MRLRILLVGVVMLSVLWAIEPHGSPAASLTEIQKKIDQKRRKLGSKQGTARLLTSQISAYNRKIRRLQGDITSLGTRQTRLQAELDRKRSVLSKTQSSLRYQRARLIRKRAEFIRSQRILARRLVELYKSDRPDLVTVVLNSKGFADLLEREEFISRISEQDHAVITAVRKARRDAKDASRRLGALERRQKQVAVAVLRQRDAIASTKNRLLDRRAGFRNATMGKARVLRNVQAEAKELEGEIADAQAQEARVRAAIQGTTVGTLPAGPIKAGSGQLIWPANGPITSPFCERRAWESCHPGIDIGIAAGTPLRAAASGTVALTQSSGASGGYGNFICVAHSASLSTCYAHLSSIGVRTGQTVTQGQVIGISGCTGRCYGAHLHFEVRIGGAVTNPLNYL